MTSVLRSFFHYAVVPWTIGIAYFEICAFFNGGPL